MTTPSETVPPPGQGAASTQALTALIVGILGIVSCCCLLSPVAWYIGSQEIRSIREGRSSAEGEVIANVGRILGMVGTALLVLLLIWVVAFGGLAVLAGLRSSMSS